MAKLVAIGDSLTQGFQSLAIAHTDLSPPAMIADQMGLSAESFRLPDFSGSGGLPLNLEWLARKLEAKLGADIRLFEWVTAFFEIRELLDDVEEYWEKGRGSRPSGDVLFHNLAVWGFEVADAYQITPALQQSVIRQPKDNILQPPSEPRLRTAYRILNPAQSDERDQDTQISITKRIRERDGEIENLIVALGGNNCLATVVELDIRETGDTPPGPNSDCTLWSPAAFKKDFEGLVERILEIHADNVFIATVPHVTIPPISRGVMEHRGRLPRERKYFDYYTHFWIRDKKFDPDRDPRLRAEDAAKIDGYIDEYNAIILDAATTHGWHVVDVARLVDELAVRRNQGVPKRSLPAPIADLSVRLFEIYPNGEIQAGGLFSLDGVHPSTCGYALIAQEYIDVMKGVGVSVPDIDFAAIRRSDTLVSHAPRVLDDMFGMLQTLEKKLHFSRWLAKRNRTHLRS